MYRGWDMCHDEWDTMNRWQRFYSINWNYSLFDRDIGFHIKYTLLPMFFVALTLIKKFPFGFIIVLRVFAGIFLLLFPFWYLLYHAEGSPSCKIFLDYHVAKYIYLLIAFLHCYVFFDAFIPKKEE
jgi:hypothetical protein